MTDLEQVALENWARQLSNAQLKNRYIDVANDFADKLQEHYYFGKQYPRAEETKMQILANICRERGINLW
jgi:hypothetical protein